MRIKRNEVTTLSSIIGKCAIKSIGSELFLPMIKMKAACTSVMEESKNLMMSMLEEIGLKEGDKPTEDQYSSMLTQQKNINEDEVEFQVTNILDLKQFTALSDENPALTASELEVLYKWLVKEV